MRDDEVSVVGLVPPQATELEDVVLGAMILEPRTIPMVAGILKAEMFYKPANMVLFEAVVKMFSDGDTVDIMTVTQKLKSMGKLEFVGGAYAITMLISSIASAANIEFHARIIVQKYIQRELIKISQEVTTLSYQDTADPFEITDETINKLIKLNNVGATGQIVKVNEVYNDVMLNVGKVRSGEVFSTGIFTHIEGLNQVINGFKAPDLFVLAARPGMGKTAFIISISRSVITSGIPVGVFSLEMSKEQLTKRVMSQLSGITYHKLDQPTLLSERETGVLHELKNTIDKSPLYIDDTPAINITQFYAKATELKALYDVRLIILDYLQLMSGIKGSRGNRESEISEISRGIKRAAKMLNIPIIALSQLNRGVESRPDKRPKLSDLRESGAIEQDADIVGLLFRPSYYGIMDVEGCVTQEEAEAYGELIIAKHRNGETATIPLRFIKNTMDYVDFKDFDTSRIKDETEEDLEAPF